jgi:hypothetical protein
MRNTHSSPHHVVCSFSQVGCARVLGRSQKTRIVVLEGANIQADAGVCVDKTDAFPINKTLCPTTCAFAYEAGGPSISCPNGINVVAEGERFNLSGGCNAISVTAVKTTVPTDTVATTQLQNGKTATGQSVSKRQTRAIVGGGMLIPVSTLLRTWNLERCAESRLAICSYSNLLTKKPTISVFLPCLFAAVSGGTVILIGIAGFIVWALRRKGETCDDDVAFDQPGPPAYSPSVSDDGPGAPLPVA